MILLTCAAGVSTAAERLGTHPVPDFVVSEIVLPIPEPELRSTFLEQLRADRERRDSRYSEHGFRTRDGTGHEVLAPAFAEEGRDAKFGKEFFRNPAHSNDLYVHFMGIAIVSSYFVDASTGNGLDYGVTFAVAMEAIDETRTKISVRTVESNACVGKTLNLHAMGFVPKCEPVPPSPLDQYRLLVYLADLADAHLSPPKAAVANTVP
jgi:hypothetical protein